MFYWITYVQKRAVDNMKRILDLAGPDISWTGVAEGQSLPGDIIEHVLP